MYRSQKKSQTRILMAQLGLPVVVACLPGMAWSDNWTHDGTYGAATVVALPGGQATLARDGADRHARTITYVQTNGATKTITRDYGPSGHKATEVENGTPRQHVYGTGLAPLLRVEGDGSLTYQVGLDTIGVDANDGTTVAHLVADLKQSTVAVLDAQGQPRQQVAYGTLGQSTSRQQSASVYVTAAQLAGYESLTAWQLGTDQLIDNRARVYAPLAGRFLALDAAGKALGYEARGNNWITRADYDGNMDELINVLKANLNVVATYLVPEENDDNSQLLFMRQFMDITEKLQKQKIPFFIGSDTLLTEDRKYNDNNFGRLVGEKRVRQLVKADLLGFVGSDALVNYGSQKFAGSNSEKIKILFITGKTFADYMEGRENMKNFLFISSQDTRKKFLDQKFWKKMQVQMIRNVEEKTSEKEFIDWGDVTVDIYTQSEIYKQYPDLFKLRPGQQELGKIKNLTQAERRERLKGQMASQYGFEPLAKPVQKEEKDEEKEQEEKQNLIEGKGKSQQANSQKLEEEDVKHQVDHGSCKGCILQ